MPIAPTDIEEQTFRIVFRGYDVREVDAFLDRIQKELARPAGEQPAAGDGSTDAGPAADGDDAAEPHVAPPARALRTLRHAERMADEMLAEAAAEAEQIRARAQAEAAQIVAAARAESSRVEAEDLLRRQRELRTLARRYDELRTEVDRLSGLERRVRESLRAWLSEHEELLQRQPVVDDVPTAEGHAVSVDRPALAS